MGGESRWQALDWTQWLLQPLLPRNIALAGRGFNCIEDVARMLVSPKDTSFFLGCSQLAPKDVADMKWLVNVRIDISV